MCDFSDLLHRYANSIPSNNLLFRVSKPCGYSQLVVIPRGIKAMVQDLDERIRKDMGEYTVGNVYFLSKHSDNASIWKLQMFYDQYLENVAVERIPLAYSIDECQYAVYQLYIDIECSHTDCCNPPMIQEQPVTLMEVEDEPTREELLSMIYSAPSPSPSSSPELVTDEQDTRENGNKLDYII